MGPLKEFFKFRVKGFGFMVYSLGFRRFRAIGMLQAALFNVL